jgi:hypothetical protein
MKFSFILILILNLILMKIIIILKKMILIINQRILIKTFRPSHTEAITERESAVLWMVIKKGCILYHHQFQYVYRVLPELQSRAPQQLKEACWLLQQLTGPLLNAFAAAEVHSGVTLSGEYHNARSQLLGTLLDQAKRLSKEGHPPPPPHTHFIHHLASL